MSRLTDTAMTAVAPAIWGSTYLVTTQMLPDGHPIGMAALRALPAGLLLLAVTRNLPPARWLGRVLILGALNFALFWSLLFVAAYRLPGGVAAVLGASQPLMVLVLAQLFLGTTIRPLAVLAALAGLVGVGVLLLEPGAGFDTAGILAGVGAAAAMAFGTVLSRKWRPEVSPPTFASWQLTAGGVLLAPFALVIEPPLPALTTANLSGLVWLGLFGAALTYWLWFRGIGRLDPARVSMLGMISPIVAVALGWIWLGEALTPVQMASAVLVLASVLAGQLVSSSAPSGARIGLPARSKCIRFGATFLDVFKTRTGNACRVGKMRSENVTSSMPSFGAPHRRES